MKVQCPKCETVYSINESKISGISGKATFATCRKCGERFQLRLQEVKIGNGHMETEDRVVSKSRPRNWGDISQNGRDKSEIGVPGQKKMKAPNVFQEQTKKSLAQRTEKGTRRSEILLVLRDVGIIVGMALTAVGLLYFLNLLNNRLALLAGSFVAFTLGFFICGLLKKSRRLEHSFRIALILWLIDIVFLLTNEATFSASVVDLVLILLSMTIGLAFSKLIKKEVRGMYDLKIYKKNPVWKFALGFGAMLFFVKIAFDMMSPPAQPNATQKAALEQKLIETAKKFNTKTPVMVDDKTRADSAASSGMTIRFRYTMVNFSQKEDDLDVEGFRNEIQKKVIKDSCKNEDIAKLLRLGMESYYDYFDKDGHLIATGVVSKTTCGY